MILFIKIPRQHPFYEIFKDRYATLMEANGTLETIQDNPLTNEQETHYLVGSWRLTQSIADQLMSEFPMVTVANTMPVGWETLSAEE